MAGQETFQMIQAVPKGAPPLSVPAGSAYVCLAGPNALEPCTEFPILVCCQYTYWAYSYRDNRDAMNIVLYDPVGGIVRQWQKPGARYLWKITADERAKNVTFWGQANDKIVMSWDELGLMKYKAAEKDVLSVAEFYGLTISDHDARRLAESLPVFDCSNCSAHVSSLPKAIGRKATSWKVGAVIGSIIGGAIGGIVGGPGGAVLGATVGAEYGAGIGLLVDASPPVDRYDSTTGEEITFVYLAAYPLGPFDNSSVFEDLFDWDFPRFGAIPEAGALAPPADGNQARVFYPTTQSLGAPNTTKYKPFNGIYKYIFVVAQVPERERDGESAYQVRIHPEDFYPSAIAANKRINHSQLSEGGRYAALMGFRSMQIYGAGSLYVLDGEIQGIDSRTGHYYYALAGKDRQMLDAALALLRDLGYDVSGVKEGQALDDWIDGNVY